MSQILEFITNHWMLVLALVGIISLLIGTEFQRRVSGVANIGPMEATRLLNQQDALFLDTRTDNEYKEGHILNSLHIPLGDLERRMGELEKFRDRPVIAYCRSGHRSATAGSKLKKQGFDTVFNLGGGIIAWQNANLPVTKK